MTAVEIGQVGVMHGRFQVFHNDHLRYALAAKAMCRHLIVGLTSPEPLNAPSEVEAPHRSAPGANPLTYYERLRMITECLADASIPVEEFSVVPFPIERPEHIENYAPKDATYHLTINDAWGEEKVRRLQTLNLRVNVLWRTDVKAMSGTQIRSLISRNGSWRELVPRATATFLEENNLIGRIANSTSEI